MKVYLASPGRKPEEAAVVKSMEVVLERAGLSVYSPFRDGIKLEPAATKEERVQVFKSNVEAIDECDIVVANIEGFDVGVLIEFGFACALNYMSQHGFVHPKPIIAYSPNPQRMLNVMLAEAVVAYTTQLEDLPKLVLDSTLWKDALWMELVE